MNFSLPFGFPSLGLPNQVGLFALVLVAILFVAWCRFFALALTEEKPEDKIVWSLVVFFGGVFGVLMYLFLRYPALKREEKKRDFEMLQKMREEFEKNQASRAKP